jgi:hypothetical protein
METINIFFLFSHCTCFSYIPFPFYLPFLVQTIEEVDDNNIKEKFHGPGLERRRNFVALP